MLFGVLSPREPGFESLGPPACTGHSGATASVWRQAWGVAGLDALAGRTVNRPDGSWLAWSGRAWWRGADGASCALQALLLLERLRVNGAATFGDVDGAFAVAWFDARSGRLGLARDRFGVEPLHYALDGESAWFGSLGTTVASMRCRQRRIDGAGLRDYLLYGFCPGPATLIDGVRRLLPGTAIDIRVEHGRLVTRTERWHRLSYREQPLTGDRDIAEAFAGALDAAVRRQLAGGGRPAVMMSGGMDSGAVAALMSRQGSREICGLSFRCDGEDYDESAFARELANALGMRHVLAELTEDDALAFTDGVHAMDCPFSDAGIEVGTWLLAKAAGGCADHVLTGDGGDEFWASHPVYAAQRIMRLYDALPIGRTGRLALKRLLNVFSDSDHKRDLRVVAKRLLPHPDLPRALRHARWKVYYDAAGLRALLDGAALPDETDAALYDAMLDAYQDFDGPAGSLDAMLYNDYRTATSFYMSRLLLLRSHGMEARLPFFDADLVALGARIPFAKKLEGMERTKRLFREAMRGVVPSVILERKGKLGHSVPMKNWLRAGGRLQTELAGVLLEEMAAGRGLVHRPVVERMLREHVTGRENHAQRLWALFVLETWLQRHIDRPVATSHGVASARVPHLQSSAS